jgi:histidine ammonia-lyase
MTVVLTGNSLTLDEVVRVARSGEHAELAPEAAARMQAARAVVDRAVARGAVAYGLTTGVASRKRAAVSGGEVGAFNRLMIQSHRVGQGPDAPEDVVRAALVRLANGFAGGTTAVRPALVERILTTLNGSDLPRVSDTARLLISLEVAAALDLEAFAANLSILHPAVAESRPYPGLRTALERLQRLLEGSALWQEDAARNLQDPLSFRGIPQVLGALRDALEFVKGQLSIELNSAHSNPLVSVDEDRVFSVSNLEIAPVAAGLDFLRIALAPALTTANERLMKLLQAPLSGLSDGLAAGSAHEDGLAEFGNAGQALASEARLLAQPVSFELASTTQAEGIEDRMTMAPLAARRLAEMVELGERIVAVELVVAAQAVDLRRPATLGVGTRRAHDAVRERVSFTGPGQALPADLEPVRELVRSGALSATT